MLDSVFGVFSGALPVKGFGEGADEVSEASETREIGNSEGVEYDEGDIERIETVAEVMGEVFTDEVISNWENLSVEERTAYLNEYYEKAGAALGIDTKGVYVDDLQSKYGYGVQGVNSGDGYLGIDISLVEDPSCLEDLLNTTTHEMRHQLQADALANPDAFPDIPQETLDQWQYEFDNYIDGSYDFEAYQAQAIETDARAFAEEVVNEYLDDGAEGAYAMTNEASEIPAVIVSDGEQASSQDEVSTEGELELDGLDAADEAAEAADAQPEIGQTDGIELEEALNKNTFSYTPGQCARISTGTQNYCPFAGSGR
ncbi:MAG: hypothetical protein LUG44_04240 [Clostridiales bacterium]|nr:hypothetical protein [Clostridiales bacterium]